MVYHVSEYTLLEVVCVKVRTGIGQDSHRFESGDLPRPPKPLVLGGVRIESCRGLDANSDGDVMLHALTNAISGVTGAPILGETADRMCLEQGITDSAEYVRRALADLRPGQMISHVSISVECSTPRLSPHIDSMRRSIGRLLGIDVDSVAITATSGEGLTDPGRGLGISVLCLVTVIEPD